MENKQTDPAMSVHSIDLLGIQRPSPKLRSLAWEWLKGYALETDSKAAAAAFIEWTYQKRLADQRETEITELKAALAPMLLNPSSPRVKRIWPAAVARANKLLQATPNAEVSGPVEELNDGN